MSISAAQLVAEVKTTGVPEGEAQLKRMSETVDKTSGGFKSMLGNALSFAGGIGIFNLASNALGFLKDQFAGCIQESMDAQDEMAQTVKVLQSTHDASGMTAQAIADLASHFSHLTKFTDDQTQVGENLLLTFTNIGKNIFPQATQTMLDLSQAMGQDTKTSAIQLGKALNDPLTGMTALQRVGVTFSDSQKEAVKRMMATNDLAGAQGIILKELQREFGGSAEAAGKTFGGQLAILHQRMDDVKQTIGDALLPILTKLMGFVSDHVMPIFNSFANWIGSSAIPGIEKFGESLSPLLGLLQSLGQDLGTMFSHLDFGEFNAAWKSFGMTISGFLGPFYKVKDGLKGFDFSGIVEQIGTLISQGLGKLTDILWGVQSVMIAVMPSFYNLADAVGPALQSVFKTLSPVISEVSGIIGGVLNNHMKTASGIAQELGKWWQTTLMPAIKQALPAFMELAKVIITDVVPSLVKIWAVGQQFYDTVAKALVPVLEKVIPFFIRLEGVIASGLAPALKFLAPYAVQAAQAIGKFAGDIATRVAPILEHFFTSLDQGLTIFLQVWKAVWPYLGPILKGVWDEIVGVIKVAWALVSGIIKIGLDILGGNWSQAWTDFKDMLAGVWDGIKGILGGAWEIVSGWVNAIIGLVVGLADTLVGHSIIPDMINSIVQWFTSLPGKAMSGVQGLVGQLTGFFGGLASQAVSWGTNIVQGVINGLLSKLGDVGNAAQQIAQKVADFLPHSPAKEGPLSKLNEFGPALVKGFSQGIVNSTPTLRAAITHMVQPAALGELSAYYAFPSMPSTASSAGGSGGGTTHVDVHVHIGTEDVTHLLGAHVVDHIRRKTGVRV